MKYVSIDIETTGIDKDWCDIIEFGAILEDTENHKSYEQAPQFHRYLKPPRPEGYRGELYAINMHCESGSGIWKELNRLDQLQQDIEKGFKELSQEDYDDAKKLISPRKLLHEFTCWLVENGYDNISQNKSRGAQPEVDLGKVVVAGKNFFGFDWNYLSPLFGDRICRRSIDPAIWYINPKQDKAPPSTSVCLQRAGIEATDEHTSLGDAWDIIRLTRRAMYMGLTVPIANK
jgi:hypothetical protein